MFNNIYETLAVGVCSINSVLSSVDPTSKLSKKAQRQLSLSHQQLYAVEQTLRKIAAEVEIEGIINDDKGRTEEEEQR